MPLDLCFWMVADEHSSFRHWLGAFFAFSQSAPSEQEVVDHRNVVLFHVLEGLWREPEAARLKANTLRS